MKRIVLTAVASSALALAAPGVASAKHGKHHQSTRHHTHARRARLEVFGGAFLAPASGSPTSAAPTTPTAGEEAAGKVVKFTGGVLTIMLKDGSTVSGKVTEQTELECRSATPSTSGGDDDQGGGDDSSTESGDQSGAVTAHESDLSSGGDGGEGDGETSGESCTTAALAEEAVVGAAELSVSGAGAVWEKVELLK